MAADEEEWEDWSSDDEAGGGDGLKAQDTIGQLEGCDGVRRPPMQVSERFLQEVFDLVKAFQLKLSAPDLLPSLSRSLLAYSTQEKLVLDLHQYYADNPQLYDYTISHDVPRCSYHVTMQKSSSSDPVTHDTAEAVAACLGNNKPRRTTLAHSVVRASNQSLLATLLSALNDETRGSGAGFASIYSMIRPSVAALKDATVFVTKDVSFNLLLINDAKMKGDSSVTVRIRMDVLIHTLEIAEMEFEMRWTPGAPESGMLLMRACDVRCKMLFDEGMRQGVEQMVKDGLLRDNTWDEDRALPPTVRTAMAAELIATEGKVVAKGVGGDISTAARGVVLGGLFRGLKAGFGAVIRNAIEEGARGDDDLFFKEEGGEGNGGGDLGGREGQGTGRGRLGNGEGEVEGMGEVGEDDNRVEEVDNRFAALLDGVDDAEKKRQEKKRLNEMQNLAVEAGKQESGNVFAALLDNVGEAEAKRQMERERLGRVKDATLKPEVGRGEEFSVCTTMQVPSANNFNKKDGAQLEKAEVDRGEERDGGVQDDQEKEEEEERGDDEEVLSESFRQRIALGYGEDGSLGGDYGKDDPPPGLKFGGYSSDFLSISWLPA